MNNFYKTLLISAIASAITGCGGDDKKEPPVKTEATPEVENAVPVISGSPLNTIKVGEQYLFLPEASDADSDDVLNFTAIGLPSWLELNATTGQITGSPEASDVGESGLITLSVSDGKAEAKLTAYSIMVIENAVVAINSAPSITGVPLTRVTSSDHYSFTPIVTDTDNDSLTFSATGLPNWLTINSDTGMVSGVAPALQGQTETIVISVSDGQDSRSLAGFSVTIEITDNNSAPVISGMPDSFAPANYEYIFIPQASDADGDKLTFSATGLPDWANINSDTGAICGQPLSYSKQIYKIVVSASDGKETANLPEFDLIAESSSPSGEAPSFTRNDIVIAGDLNDGWQEYADYTIYGSGLGSYWTEISGKMVAEESWQGVGSRYLLNAAGTQPLRDELCNRYLFSQWTVIQQQTDDAKIEIRTWDNTHLDDALFDSANDNFTTHIDGQTVVYTVKYQHDLELRWEYAQLRSNSFEGLADEVKSQLTANGNDYAAVDLRQVPQLIGGMTHDLDWINITDSFFTDAEGNDRTWYIVTNAFDGTLAIHETNLQQPYADWVLFNVPGGSRVHVPGGFTYKTFAKTETIVELPPISSFDEASGSFSFEPGFGSDPALPFHLFLDKTKAQEKLAELTQPVASVTFPTVEEGFSPQWLTGKTLYDVSHDGYTPAFVDQLTFTSEDTVEVRGLVNRDSSYDGYYKVHDDGLLQLSKKLPFPVIQGFKVACGGTEDYIKVHFFWSGDFSEAHLLFVDKQKAIDHAAALTDTVTPCNE